MFPSALIASDFFNFANFVWSANVRNAIGFADNVNEGFTPYILSDSFNSAIFADRQNIDPLIRVHPANVH